MDRVYRIVGFAGVSYGGLVLFTEGRPGAAIAVYAGLLLAVLGMAMDEGE